MKSNRRRARKLFSECLCRTHSFRHRQLPAGHVWIHDSKLKTVIICFPEQRNLYNKIFGGFLMRQAFELAWTNVAMFS
jgi:acyl-coenzyme A thioesterase 9